MLVRNLLSGVLIIMPVLLLSGKLHNCIILYKAPCQKKDGGCTCYHDLTHGSLTDRLRKYMESHILEYLSLTIVCMACL